MKTPSNLEMTISSLRSLLLINYDRLQIPCLASRITKSSTKPWIFFSTLKLLYSPTTRQKRGVAASQSSVGYLVRSMLSPRQLLKLLGRLLCGSAPELVRYRNRMKRRCSQTAAPASGGSAIEADVLPNRMRHRTIFAPIYVAHLNKNRLPYTKYLNVA